MDTTTPAPEPVMFSVAAHEAEELRAAGLNCLLAGQAADAQQLFRAGAIKHPADIDFRYRLASATLAKGDEQEAALYLADARNLHGQSIVDGNIGELAGKPLGTEQKLNLGHSFYGHGQITAASVLFQRVAEERPDDLNVLSVLALSLMHQGRIEECTATYETIIRRLGSSPSTHSALHYARVFEQAGPQTLFEEGRRWRQLCEDRVARRPQRAVGIGAKLRVGYFSPTFNGHQLAHFFLPALEAHDRTRFEIRCYSHADADDKVGRAVVAASDGFSNLHGLSDDAFCDRIAADGVDILVDLWGHNAGNRLMAFAQRPAPVQVSWLNYINTTGLTAFDAVLHPDGYRVDGDQAWFSEPIHNVGPVVAPYRVFDAAPDAGPTPALSGGGYRFVSAAHPAKINLDVVRTWSAILREAPHVTLELRYSYYKDPALRRSIGALFESCGVAAERILFPPPETGAEFRRALQQADLVLDPFPYQGMTTTLDALAVGVPVLAYEGDYLAVRVAASALRVCGLDELVAASLDEYIANAIALANDPVLTNAIRQRVRPAFEASAWRDEAGFTQRLEAVFERLAAAA